MSRQPEALRLADAIISARDLMWHRDAAAELRRLHALLIDQAWSEGSAQASRICAEEITRLQADLCEQKRIASNEHAEADRLRSELATLRAENYETQSLLAGAEAERELGYTEGYTAGYDNGHSEGFTKGADLCVDSSLEKIRTAKEAK